MTPQHAPRAQFEPGDLIAGRYRIVSLIGVGGLGRVYLARHIELDSEVAMKVLRQEVAERPEAVQRFSREAQASVRLRSERVARVFDVGTHDGTPYFVMEYLRGCNLLELKQQDSVDVPTLCEFFIQACEGLAEAHAQGVVHRDIKPENLFVVRDANGWRSLKIFDFGISKFSLTGKHSDIDISGRRTELMMGTPLYISPEQIRSTRDVDHRTDLWSLGVVMFEVLSGGMLPFREDGEITALIAEVLEAPHRSLADVAPDVPEGLAAIVDRCLVKDREARYQTAAEVALDLLPFAPARARASAERAVAAMQVAGLMPLNADLGSARTSHPSLMRSSSRPPAPPTMAAAMPAPVAAVTAAPLVSAPATTTPAPPMAAPVVAAPAVTAPVVAAPAVSAPAVTTAPVVAAPVVAAPAVSAPSAPPLTPPAVFTPAVPVAATASQAPPAPAHTVATPSAPSHRPVPAMSVPAVSASTPPLALPASAPTFNDEGKPPRRWALPIAVLAFVALAVVWALWLRSSPAPLVAPTASPAEPVVPTTPEPRRPVVTETAAAPGPEGGSAKSPLAAPNAASAAPVAAAPVAAAPAPAAQAQRRYSQRQVRAVPAKAAASVKAPAPDPTPATRLELQRER
ncbi:MAG TPA: protein kinase [Polyangiaceae bacterium]|nr:protein kinase [Polyangiaceae bacterium]